MSIPDAVWSQAYARQSLSDRLAYDHLCDAKGLPHCHRLHYLQMHLEKLGKAYLHTQSLSDGELQDLRRAHSVIQKAVPLIVRFFWRKANYSVGPDPGQLGRIRRICRELDLLHPTVDDGGRRPDNVEYPWPSVRGFGMVAPCEHDFKVDGILRNKDGIMLLKIAQAAVRELNR